MTSEGNAALMDLRDGGRWSLAQRGKNDLLHLAARAALGVGRLPPHWRARLGSVAGSLIYALAPSLRRTAIDQLGRAFPQGDAPELARRTFRELGVLLAEATAAVAGGSAVLPFPENQRAVLDEARAAGCGVVLASAHLGPFERVATTLATTLAGAEPFAVVGRESYDPRLMSLYRRLRRYETIYRGAPGAGVRMVRVLRTGGVLGIPMDLKTRAPSVDADLLGLGPVPTAVGPARLALRTGARVVVATVGPHDGDLAVTVTAVGTSDLGRDTASATELTRRLNAELDRRIRALPHFWPWMHRRS